MAFRPISQWTDDELFHWLDADLRREDRQQLLTAYAHDPLRLGRTLFPAHFRLPSASWHDATLRWLCGLPETARVSAAASRVGEFTNPTETLTSREGLTSRPPPCPDQAPADIVSSLHEVSAPAWPSVRTGRRLAFAAPRGHAKSKLASFLLPLYAILTNRKHFIIIISNTEGPAIDFVRPLRAEWETNTALRNLCPELTPNKDKWTDGEFELSRNGKLCHKVLALSQGKQIRGRTFMEWRPDLIIIDDGETNEMVASDLQRLKYEDWVDTSVLHIDYDNDILFVGNIIHEHALMNRLVRKPTPEDAQKYGYVESRLIVALDASGHSTWPEKETTETLLAVREADPYAFAQEKQNEPVDPRYCPFKAEFFTERRWWSHLPDALSISLTVDPAWTIRDYSKETALVCAGWDNQGRLWVLDEHHGKYEDPSLIMALILDWYKRWQKNEQVNPQQRFFCIGIDTVSAQKAALFTPLRKLLATQGFHPLLRELKADRDKIRRIWQLEPLFRQERIFLRPDMSYLQHQLQGFPRNVQGGLVDVIDALAYHLQLETYKPSAPAQPPTPARHPFEMSFDDYARLHEDVRAFRRQFPEVSDTMDDVLVGLLAGRN